LSLSVSVRRIAQFSRLPPNISDLMRRRALEAGFPIWRCGNPARGAQARGDSIKIIVLCV
jgi:hypothetical protein